MKLDLEPVTRRNGISLTPLIDVVFILLMFFMLTSSFVRWDTLDINTPVATNTNNDADPVAVLLNADRGLIINHQQFRLHELVAETFQYESWFINNEPVVVYPEADTALQLIVTSLSALKAMGLTRVSLGQSRQVK